MVLKVNFVVKIEKVEIINCKPCSAVIRDLHGTIEREKAVAGILITLEESSKPMIQEAKQAGQFKGDFATFDRLQIVTVQEILDNKRMNLPLYAEVIKRAKADSGAKQLNLYGEQ